MRQLTYSKQAAQFPGDLAASGILEEEEKEVAGQSVSVPAFNQSGWGNDSRYAVSGDSNSKAQSAGNLADDLGAIDSNSGMSGNQLGMEGNGSGPWPKWRYALRRFFTTGEGRPIRNLFTRNQPPAAPRRPIPPRQQAPVPPPPRVPFANRQPLNTNPNAINDAQRYRTTQATTGRPIVAADDVFARYPNDGNWIFQFTRTGGGMIAAQVFPVDGTGGRSAIQEIFLYPATVVLPAPIAFPAAPAVPAPAGVAALPAGGAAVWAPVIAFLIANPTVQVVFTGQANAGANPFGAVTAGLAPGGPAATFADLAQLRALNTQAAFRAAGVVNPIRINAPINAAPGLMITFQNLPPNFTVPNPMRAALGLPLIAP